MKKTPPIELSMYLPTLSPTKETKQKKGINKKLVNRGENKPASKEVGCIRMLESRHEKEQRYRRKDRKGNKD
jgi:hypothetical protein